MAAQRGAVIEILSPRHGARRWLRRTAIEQLQGVDFQSRVGHHLRQDARGDPALPEGIVEIERIRPAERGRRLRPGGRLNGPLVQFAADAHLNDVRIDQDVVAGLQGIRPAADETSISTTSLNE